MITLTAKTNGNEVDIFPNQLFGLFESKSMECTFLITTAGGQFPVEESKEDILKAIDAYKKSLKED